MFVRVIRLVRCLLFGAALGVVLFPPDTRAQVRPPGGGGGGVPPGGGGGGGGGGGTVTESALINAPRGALVGSTVSANAVVVRGAPVPGMPQTPPTFQWNIAGGRITSDPRVATIQFVADRAGTVLLNVAISLNGTSYTPTAEVPILSPADAGQVSVAPTVATNVASVSASVTPAQNGDRTFRWTVSGGAAILSGQGTSSITLRPGGPGPKEIRCAVNLQELVNVPVRAYLVVTGTGDPVNVVVNGGSGGGVFPGGSRVDIFAHSPPAGQVFDRWTGDTAALGTGPLATLLARAVITVPATPITLTASYKAAPAWTPVVVTNFNPQIPANQTSPANPVATTLAYHVPVNPAGLVFLLHAQGGDWEDWFSRPEQLALAKDVVAAGYGVAALNSINRNLGTWTAQGALANNLDALNHAEAHERLVRDGVLGGSKPVFFLGAAAGAQAALRYADLLATGANARPVKGAVSYLAAGLDALAATSRVPQFFALAANDAVLGAAGLAAAREHAQLLLGRGVASGSFTNAVSPVHAGRFRSLGLNDPTFTAADAESVWVAVKNAGYLDANLYPRSLPLPADVAAILPPAQRSRAADVVAQLAVASAAGEFYSDANARVINFLNTRTADGPVPAPGRLVNLSARSKIAFVDDTFVLGFNLSGTQRATLLIRGIGPALVGFGLSEALTAPRLEINQGSRLLATSDGWDQTAGAAQISAAAASVGAFALQPGSLDSAVLVQLDPGTYTATVRGIGGSTGDVLAEIYDISRSGTRLTNLSTLARINDDGELLIPGIVVAGNSPRTLVVRAVGRGLVEFGLGPESVLGDPRISILNGIQTVVTNNNWAQAGAATLTAVFPAIGAFPLRSPSDAALITALAPGSYTLQAGAAPFLVAPPDSANPDAVTVTPPNPTGAVLVEIYEVP